MMENIEIHNKMKEYYEKLREEDIIKIIKPTIDKFISEQGYHNHMKWVESNLVYKKVKDIEDEDMRNFVLNEFDLEDEVIILHSKKQMRNLFKILLESKVEKEEYESAAEVRDILKIFN